jgi:ribonuclease E
LTPVEKKILISSGEPDECRIAVLEDGVLEEYCTERAGGRGLMGNVYVGRVVNVEPGIQAAFVDLGGDRNGFLHASDCTPETRGSTGPRSRPPPIGEFIRPGQEIHVQVTREGFGNKGPTLTTYVSLPGRYVVLMPSLGRCGVSRRITDESERSRLRGILDDLVEPDEGGVILRTAAARLSAEEIAGDLDAVRAAWREMTSRAGGARAPTLIHEEPDLFTRTMRDLLADDVTELLVDSDEIQKRAHDLLESLGRSADGLLKRHDGPGALHETHGLAGQIERLFDRRVPLPSGGHLVIDRTEALVAIDVNSGSLTGEKGLEETAFKTDMEAVPEICRQLRLRDLGGVIIVDLIDVRTAEHRRLIETAFREHLARDRARIRVSRISEFGIVQMTRQRTGPCIDPGRRAPCPTCGGSGTVPGSTAC